MKLVCIIIASHSPTYDKYKQLWLNIIDKVPNIDFYFIYNGENEFCKDGMNLYFPYEENIKPGIFRKTIAVYEWLLKEDKNFTHVLRSNLSSFYIFDKLLSELEKLPQTNLVYGKHMFNRFPTGCGSTFSRDVIRKLVENKNIINPNSMNDDECIGYILSHLKINILNYNFIDCFDYQNKDDDFLNVEHFHYRTTYCRINRTDLFEQLLKKYY